VSERLCDRIANYRHVARNGKLISVFQIATPAQGLLVRSGIDNGLVFDAVYPDWISPRRLDRLSKVSATYRADGTQSFGGRDCGLP
jgi:hypothetical protein